MKRLILTSTGMLHSWPFAAERLAQRLQATVCHQLPERADLAEVELLANFGHDVNADDFPRIRVAITEHDWANNREFPATTAWRARGATIIGHRNEGYWGQSVAEFALGLTLAGLRRIPQTHNDAQADLGAWDYTPRPADPKFPHQRQRAYQYGDDPRFVGGTIAGKRVGVIGLGNIGSRFADWCSHMGAEVVGYDPLAQDPSFHRAKCRRVFRLEDVVDGCDILAPMMPLLDKTAGLVRADIIDRLPRGALVVLVTRAGIVDMTALRRRVIAGELSLAADVFDVEPLPLNDPLLHLPHVVHTPHNAGRTRDANYAWADAVIDQVPAEFRVGPMPHV